MRLVARLRRFARARKGLAALEFALIAPMMVFLLFGAVELIDALDVDQRVQNAASSLADVVSRDTEVSNTELSGLWTALDILMYPDTSTNMSACITSISIDAAGNSHTVWSEQHNGFGTCPSADVSLSASMRQPNTSLIVAETHYNYSPRLNFVFSGAFQMRHITYRRSRIVDPIQRVS